jgi:HEAT repeat protein
MSGMMKRFAMTLAAALFAAASAAAMPQQGAALVDGGIGASNEGRAEARAADARYPQDPADSLYRAARERLNRNDYERAAEMFRQVRQRYPRSSYAPQAFYYQAFALYRIGEEDELRAALDALRELERAYPDATVAREDARSLQTRIEAALAQLGDAEAAGELHEQATGEGCDEIRMAALNGLLQMRSQQALPILQKVLANRSADACSVEMREKAVFLLAQHARGDSVVDVMLDVVRNDPSSEVREKAVFWLSQVPGERTVEALEQILMSSQDRQLQEKALFALSQHRSERAARILRDYAMQEGAPLELREKAIFWIGQSGAEANVGFLKDLYRSTREPELKEKIIFSIAQMRGEENAGWLLDLAIDPNESVEVRKKAIFWAGQMGMPVEEMGALYERMPDRELKEQIIFALSQSNKEEAVDWLMDIARNEREPELRKKAIFWLSQSRDPRVAEFLLQIIEG